MKLIPMKGEDEFEALDKKAKKFYHWRPRVRKKIKRQYNKRVRQKMKQVSGWK